VGEYWRERPLLEVEHSMKGERIRDLPAELVGGRDAPRYLRSDDCSEFIATEVKGFLEMVKVEAFSIEPGAPWQTGDSERCDGASRIEPPNSEICADLPEAKTLAARWRREDNLEGPRRSLGYGAPTSPRGAACNRCTRGCAPSLRGGSRGTCAFDGINPTHIVLCKGLGVGPCRTSPSMQCGGTPVRTWAAWNRAFERIIGKRWRRRTGCTGRAVEECAGGPGCGFGGALAPAAR
jgi:hypothetical protein